MQEETGLMFESIPPAQSLPAVKQLHSALEYLWKLIQIKRDGNSVMVKLLSCTCYQREYKAIMKTAGDPIR